MNKISKENEDLYQKKKVEIKSIDCFLFKMLCSSFTSIEANLLSPGDDINPLAEESPQRMSKTYWGNLRKEVMGHGLVSISSIALSKIIFEHRSLILERLDTILRVSVRIETNNYQRSLSLKLLAFENVHSTGLKAQRFFKILAESIQSSSQLMEVLCISPEDLNTICSLCSCRQDLPDPATTGRPQVCLSEQKGASELQQARGDQRRSLPL